MKKITFIFLMWSVLVNAQVDPDLFNKNWYLYDVLDTDFNEYLVRVEGYQVYGEPYDISPYVVIDSSLNFNGVGICDTFEGMLQQDGNSNAFLAMEVTITDEECEIPSMDEEIIMGPFGYVPDQPDFYTIYNVGVFDDDDGFQTMSYITQPFIVYRYRNTPVLANADFKKALFSLYPNPNQGEIRISSSQQSFIKTIKVYASHGKELINIENEISQDSIDISHLKSGVYFVEIETLTGREVHRVIKE